MTKPDHAEAERIARLMTKRDDPGFDPWLQIVSHAYLDARAHQRTPGTVEVCPNSGWREHCIGKVKEGGCEFSQLSVNNGKNQCPLKRTGAPE